MTDLLAGQVHVMFDNVPTSLQYIRAGKLRALAVTSSTRSELLPDLPTVGDFLPGYEATAWYGLGAPTGTPPTLSTSSTRRRMRSSPIPRWRSGSPISAPRC